MSRLLALLCLFPCAAFAEASTMSDILPAAGSHARSLPIVADGFAGSSINVVAGLQNTLFTSDGVQFAAFYVADGTLTLAKRALREDSWSTVRTAHRGNVNDAHNTAAIAVDGDGFLHIAWDHHGNALNYARGATPGSLELGPKQPMTGLLERSVTYPQFLRLPDGDLLFFYRDGGSGRGNLVLNRYSTKTRTWTQVHANLINGERARSAYTTFTVDRKGVLHMAWNWRDTPDVATNHDLCYARSADGGATWTTSTGASIAVPFTAANAEYALTLPKGRSLMNPPSIAVDANGHPIIANYWCPEGSPVPQYHIVRHDGKTWKVSQVTQRTSAFVLSGTSTKRPPISRSAMLATTGLRGAQELHLVYRDDERDGRIVVVSCRDLAAASPAWSVRDLTASPVGAWEPSIDPEQAIRRGQLHMLVQRVEQRDGNDRQASAVAPSPIAVLTWSPADGTTR